MKGWRQNLWVLVLGLMAMSSPAAAQQVLQTTIAPQPITIDALYNGGELRVAGQLRPDCEAVVRIVGERGELRLKRKGKVGGLLWMNLESVTFENLPKVLIINTAREFSELLGPQPTTAPAAKLDLPYLRQEARILPESGDKDALFNDLLKLKASEGLYGSSSDRLHYLRANETQKSFEVMVPIPARFPPGKYRVEVYAVRQGDVIEQTGHPLEVKLVGFPAFLSSLAFQYGAVYGLCAVVVAVLAGLLTGVLFAGSKGGSH
jgi:uncharacterized protein (TIGR02186 family)